MLKRIIAFDLDDVICYRDKKYESMGPAKYKYCIPIESTIEMINALYDEGFFIKIYTSRGMSQFNEDLDTIEEELRSLTEESLLHWGVKYHKLIFGKEHYDLIIDDKALNIKDITSVSFIKNFLNL